MLTVTAHTDHTGEHLESKPRAAVYYTLTESYEHDDYANACYLSHYTHAHMQL